MSRHRENFDDTPDGDFSLMPEGTYEVKILNATVGPSKSSGIDVWCLDMEITDRMFTGRRLWLYISMKPEAKSMRKGTLTALGVNTAEGERPDLIDDVIGRKALAIVYHDTYQGQKREKVKRLRSIKPSTGTTAPEEEIMVGEFGEAPF